MRKIKGTKIPTGYRYDSEGREVSYKSVNGNVWYIYTRNAKGNATSYQDSEGYWYTQTYDSAGNELVYRDSDGLWSKNTYDSKGNLLSYEDNYNSYVVLERGGEYSLKYDAKSKKYRAGCRGPWTAKEALNHWKYPRTDNAKRAKAFVLAIERNEKLLDLLKKK